MSTLKFLGRDGRHVWVAVTEMSSSTSVNLCRYLETGSKLQKLSRPFRNRLFVPRNDNGMRRLITSVRKGYIRMKRGGKALLTV